MGKWGKRIAAVALAGGMLMAVAPPASATGEVPCETIFGEYICQQLDDTGQFVNDTIDRLGPAIEEWRDRVAAAGKWVTDTVWCHVSGDCWPLVIQP